MRPSSVPRGGLRKASVKKVVEEAPEKVEVAGNDELVKKILAQAKSLHRYRVRLTKVQLLANIKGKGLSADEGSTKSEIADILAEWDLSEAGLAYWAERLQGE